MFTVLICFPVSVFDSLLFRPAASEDGPHYEEVQKVLREEIVNPLRGAMFVRADRVMRLRKLLDKIGSVSGMTSEEKGECQNCKSNIYSVSCSDLL